MKLNLFRFSLLEIYRSSNFGKSVATTIMLVFLGLYFMTVFFVLGFVGIPAILGDKFQN